MYNIGIFGAFLLSAGEMPKQLLRSLMTAPTPAKIRRYSLAQWMAVCAVALVLSGCGGGGGGGDAPPPLLHDSIPH